MKLWIIKFDKRHKENWLLQWNGRPKRVGIRDFTTPKFFGILTLGFVVLEKDGEMIGSGSIVSYDEKFGFMGFFIIKPEYRSKGLGTKLWFWRRDKLLSRLKKGQLSEWMAYLICSHFIPKVISSSRIGI